MDRERCWAAHIVGDMVVVRHYAVLAPGEELDDDPPTETMTLAQWNRRHDEFGCGADGAPRTMRPGVGTTSGLSEAA